MIDPDKITVTPWQCSICTTSEFTPAILNCTHTFCHNCIKKFQTVNNKCPTCSSIITTVILNADLAAYTKKPDISYKANEDIVHQVIPKIKIQERVHEERNNVERNNVQVNEKPKNFLQNHTSRGITAICFWIMVFINFFSLSAINGLLFATTTYSNYWQYYDSQYLIAVIIENIITGITIITIWLMISVDVTIRSKIWFTILTTFLLGCILSLFSVVMGSITYTILSDNYNMVAYFYSIVAIWLVSIIIIEIPIMITLIIEASPCVCFKCCSKYAFNV